MTLEKYEHHIVGKKLGQWVWFHIDYIELMTGKAEQHAICSVRELYAPDANIIKLNLKTRAYQLIFCPRFDDDHEPTLAYTFDSDSLSMRRYKTNRPIFHHKHMFVRSDYVRFDINESDSRTKSWKQFVPSSDKGFYLKIGRERYWNEWLSENGLEPSSPQRNQ